MLQSPGHLPHQIVAATPAGTLAEASGKEVGGGDAGRGHVQHDIQVDHRARLFLEHPRPPQLPPTPWHRCSRSMSCTATPE